MKFEQWILHTLISLSVLFNCYVYLSIYTLTLAMHSNRDCVYYLVENGGKNGFYLPFALNTRFDSKFIQINFRLALRRQPAVRWIECALETPQLKSPNLNLTLICCILKSSVAVCGFCGSLDALITRSGESVLWIYCLLNGIEWHKVCCK